MDIREGKPIQNFMGSNVRVLGRNQLQANMLTWADEVLVATNKARITYNNQIRQMLGRGPMPEDGDKIVCLRNYWDDLSEGGDALVNGTIGYLHMPQDKMIEIPFFAHTSVREMLALNADFVTDDDDVYPSVDFDKDMILTGKPCLDWRDSYALGKLRSKIGDIVPRQCAYGYAITGHKAQGSEWDKVLVVEEDFPFKKDEHAKWLYTCVTRAADKLVLVRNV